MSGFSNPIIGGGGALAYPSIHSPNFNIANPPASPANSWAFLRNGTAYVFGLVVQGGAFLQYSPSPGLGNLIASTNATGPDAYGNATLPGTVTYQNVGGVTPFQAIQVNGARLAFYGAASAGGPWTWRGNDWMPGSTAYKQVSNLGGVKFQATSQNDITIGGSLTIIYPSGDLSGATDAAAVNAALATGNVQLMPGLYYVSSPIIIPSWTTLRGPLDVSLDNGTPASQVAGTAGLAGEVVLFSGVTSARLAGVVVECSSIGGTTASGIGMTGACYDVHLDDVLVRNAPHNGVSTSGHHHRFTRATVTGSGNFGFSLANLTDSTFDNCLAFGSSQANWNLQNMSNCILTGCRAEWSANSDGFSFSGAGWSGTVVLAGCSTDHNAGIGIHVGSATASATETGGIVVSGFKAHADQGTQAVRIQGAGIPVTISGLQVDTGQNPNTLAFWPQAGVSIGSISTSVIVSAATIGCRTGGTAWAWDGTGVVARSGAVSAVGNPGAIVFTRLADI